MYDLPQVVEERHRIDVDCRRTDRTQPLFSSAHSPEDVKRQRRVSTISPQTADIGAQSPSKEHIDRMAGILLTYNFYEKELGELEQRSLFVEVLIGLQATSRACRIFARRST